MENLERFVDAQERDYDKALNEIRAGAKRSHWIWYIFPQIAGLGFSENAIFYSIKDLQEAALYYAHPLLGVRLREISRALLQINGKAIWEIFGSPDDMKLRSCMTLFASLENADPVFEAVLLKFFNNKKDEQTLRRI